jgi:hypothetical protein
VTVKIAYGKESLLQVMTGVVSVAVELVFAF